MSVHIRYRFLKEKEDYLKDEHKQRQSIAGASIQNQGSSGQSNNVGFPDHIKRVLDLYKNF